MRDPRALNGRGLAATVVLAIVAIVAVLAMATSARVVAGEARPAVDDPALEARVWNLANELRCLVCQNQTIADSHAELATDLKNQIREQIGAGRSDRQIIDFMVERYGDFVLYRPPVKMTTVLLWFGPFLLLVGALVAFVVYFRRRRQLLGAERALDDTDRARVREILGQTAEKRS